LTLKGLADRWAALDVEIRQLDDQLEVLVEDAAPRLIALPGVGSETGGALLVAIGDNPDRLHSEAALAALCGASPVDASSGRQQRRRLNRGGNRDANRALWVIVMCRLAKDATTRAIVEKRAKQGLSKREIVRCLKRCVARQILPHTRPDTSCCSYLCASWRCGASQHSRPGQDTARPRRRGSLGSGGVHICANLGNDDLRDTPRDTGDGVEPVQHFFKWALTLSRFYIELLQPLKCGLFVAQAPAGEVRETVTLAFAPWQP